MEERGDSPARSAGGWRDQPGIIWLWMVLFVVATATAPLAWTFVPGFWAYVVYAAVLLAIWLVAVLVLVPRSAGQR